MQLERILHSQGFGTRKECRFRIRSGEVSIAGEVIEDPQAEVSTDGLEFDIAGERWRFREKVFVLLHKPPGYECSHRPLHHPSVFSLLPAALIARGIQSVGRLDQDTSGLLLLSDDGQFIHRYSSGKKRVPKIYRAVLKHAPDEALVDRLLAGVQLHDEPAPIAAQACQVIGPTEIALTVTEGKYHQVKRMVAAAGNRVEALHRTQLGGLVLPEDLLPGQWRWLEEADLAKLADFS